MAAIHDVKLVGPGGRMQPIKIQIVEEGLKLMKPSGDALDLFKFERILKWLPSSNRTQNPGDAQSLDVSLHTNRGKQDLRMQAQSPAAMESILGALDANLLLRVLCFL